MTVKTIVTIALIITSAVIAKNMPLFQIFMAVFVAWLWRFTAYR